MFNCADLQEDLPLYFPGQSIKARSEPQSDVIASLVFNGSTYRLTNRTKQEPRFHKTAVNAMCDLISDLALSMAEAGTSELCFHASAVALENGLVLFPAMQRAGKSVLSLAMARLGGRIFSDDFLPVSLTSGKAVGRATGTSPRLRLPLPEAIAPAIKAMTGNARAPNNGQYVYVPLGEDQLARAMEEMPVIAVVLPNRQDAGPSTLTHASQSTALKSLLKQNFATHRHGALVLDDLAAIATSLPGFELCYSNPEQAAKVISSELGGLRALQIERAGPLSPRVLGGSSPVFPASEEPREYRRNEQSHAFILDDCLFYARPDGSQVGYMDGTAVHLWHLLEEPTSVEAAIEVLQEVFPTVPLEKLRNDTNLAFDRFLEQGLIRIA